MGLILYLLKNLPASLHARRYAFAAGLPGKEFDTFGRLLALRNAVRGRSITQAVSGLLNPVSSVRYFEFPALVGYVLHFLADRPDDALAFLDISSPRLFPFFLVEKLDQRVVMINPDTADFNITRKMATGLRNRDRLQLDEGVDATRLPYADERFDCVISISVVEHLNGQEMWT